MSEDKSTPRPWDLSDATIREWAVSLANLRQGQSFEPRCEPPAAVDIELCRASILTMFRAMPKSAVNSHDAMKQALRDIAEGWVPDYCAQIDEQDNLIDGEAAVVALQKCAAAALATRGVETGSAIEAPREGVRGGAEGIGAGCEG